MRDLIVWAINWIRVVVLHHKAWAVTESHDGTRHVYPLMDQVTHTADDDCVCGPRTELHKDEDGDDLWLCIHHSLDGRERDHVPVTAYL